MIKSNVMDFSEDWERTKDESQGLEKDFLFIENGFFKTSTTNKDLHKLPDNGFWGSWILKIIKREDAKILLEAAPKFINEKFFEKCVNKSKGLKEQFLNDFEKYKMYSVRVNIATQIVIFEAMGEKCK